MKSEMFWFQIRVLSLLSDLEEAVKDFYLIFEHAGEVLLLLCFLCKKNSCASLSFEILCGKRRKWRRGKYPVCFFLWLCVCENAGNVFYPTLTPLTGVTHFTKE